MRRRQQHRPSRPSPLTTSSRTRNDPPRDTSSSPRGPSDVSAGATLPHHRSNRAHKNLPRSSGRRKSKRATKAQTTTAASTSTSRRPRGMSRKSQQQEADSHPHRSGIRTAFLARRAAAKKQMTESRRSHARNLKVSRTREKADLEFELTRKARQRVKQTERYGVLAQDVGSSIASFERGLERLGRGLRQQKRREEEELSMVGVGTSTGGRLGGTSVDSPSSSSSSSTSGFAFDDSSLAKLKKESMHYLREIKKKKSEEKIARKDREHRRRKILIDQQRLFRTLERAQRRDLMIRRILTESESERQLAKELSKTRKWREVVRRNRRLRRAQLRRAESEEAQRKREEYRGRRRREMEDLRHRVDELTKERDRLTRVRESEKRRERERCCGAIARDLVFLSVCEGGVREIGEGVGVRELRDEWRRMFVGDLIGSVERKGAMSEMRARRAKREREKDRRMLMGRKDAGGGVSFGEEEEEEEVDVDDDLGGGDDGEGGEEIPWEVRDVSEKDAEVIDQEECTQYCDRSGTWAPTLTSSPSSSPKEGQEEERDQQEGGAEADSVSETAVGTGAVPEILIHLQRISQGDALQQPTEMPIPLDSSKLHLAILGKPFSGNSQLADQLAEKFDLVVVRPVEVLRLKMLEERSSAEGSGSEWVRKAAMQLRSGSDVSCDVMTHLLAERFCELDKDENCRGWVLDGYPSSVADAKTLELVVAGFDSDAKPPLEDKSLLFRLREVEQEAMQAAEEADPFAPDTFPFRVLDGLFVLQTSNDIVFRRAAGQVVDPATGTLYHLETSLPPSTVDRSTLVPFDAVNLDKVELVWSLMGFSTSQRKMGAWFAKFPHLSEVVRLVDTGDESRMSRSRTLGDLSKHVEKIVRAKRRQKRLAEGGGRAAAVVEAAEEEEGGEDRPLDLDDDDDDPDAAERAKPSVLTKECAALLEKLWYSLETPWVRILKRTLRSLRAQRRTFLRRLFTLKQDFATELTKTEANAAILQEFSAKFNAVPIDVRGEAVVKNEFHERAVELRHRLWRTADERKEQANGEIVNISREQWIPTHKLRTTVRFAELLQLEASRYVQGVRFLTEYLREKWGKLVDVSVDPSTYSSLFSRLIEAEESLKVVPQDGGRDLFQQALEKARELAKTFGVPMGGVAAAGGRRKRDRRKEKLPQKEEGVSDANEAAYVADLTKVLGVETKLYLSRIEVLERKHSESLGTIDRHISHLILEVFPAWVAERNRVETAAVSRLVGCVQECIEREELLPDDGTFALSLDPSDLMKGVGVDSSPESEIAEEKVVFRQHYSEDFTATQAKRLVDRLQASTTTIFLDKALFVSFFLVLTDSSFGDADLPHKWVKVYKRADFEKIADECAMSRRKVNWREFVFEILLKHHENVRRRPVLARLEAKRLGQMTKSRFLSREIPFLEHEDVDHVSMSPKDFKECVFRLFSNRDTSSGGGDSGPASEETIDLVEVALYASLDSQPIKTTRNAFAALGGRLSGEDLYRLFHFNVEGVEEEEDLYDMHQIRELCEEGRELTFQDFMNDPLGRMMIQHATHLVRKRVDPNDL